MKDELPNTERWAQGRDYDKVDLQTTCTLADAMSSYLAGLMSRLLSAAGFDLVKYRNLSGGIAALHSAWRL